MSKLRVRPTEVVSEGTSFGDLKAGDTFTLPGRGLFVKMKGHELMGGIVKNAILLSNHLAYPLCNFSPEDKVRPAEAIVTWHVEGEGGVI